MIGLCKREEESPRRHGGALEIRAVSSEKSIEDKGKRKNRLITFRDHRTAARGLLRVSVPCGDSFPHGHASINCSPGEGSTSRGRIQSVRWSCSASTNR